MKIPHKIAASFLGLLLLLVLVWYFFVDTRKDIQCDLMQLKGHTVEEFNAIHEMNSSLLASQKFCYQIMVIGQAASKEAVGATAVNIEKKMTEFAAQLKKAKEAATLGLQLSNGQSDLEDREIQKEKLQLLGKLEKEFSLNQEYLLRYLELARNRPEAAREYYHEIVIH